MLRLLHLADARLGARHPDLGEAAAAQRERQFAALATAVDLAIEEKVDLVLIAGDLFATGVVSRRTVERAAAEIGRLAASRIRTVILPGEHDPYDRASVYRAYDLGALAGLPEGSDLVTVLTPARPWVGLDALDAVVVGCPDGGPDDAARGLEGLGAALQAAPDASWRIGMVHAAPEEAGGELTREAIAATGLVYLALGGTAAPATGTGSGVTWGVPGSPEQVEVKQAEPGAVLLVTLDMVGGAPTVSVEERVAGRTTHRDIDIDVRTVTSQADLVEALRREGHPDQVLDVRLGGVLADSLVIDPAEVEDALRTDFLRVRVHDGSQPALTSGELPPADTVAGAFIRGVEGRIADLEATGEPDAEADAAELREVLRLGRRLLAGAEVRA